jgi:hypothetical protein
MAISEDGKNFSCEYPQKGFSFVQVPQDHPLNIGWINSGGIAMRDLLRPYLNYPMFIKQPDTYSAIQVFEFDSGEQTIVMLHGRVFGNSIFYPPTIPFRTTFNSGILPPPSPGAKQIPALFGISGPSYANPSLTLTAEEARRRFSIKRNACQGVWSMDSDPKIAVVYQTLAGFGGIEIRDTTHYSFHMGKRDYQGKKTGVYEVPCSIQDFKSLAWKPGKSGDLTVLSEQKLWGFNGQAIDHGRENSGLIRNYEDPRNSAALPVRSVFNIQPVLLAENIDGSSHLWVSDKDFIFRSTNGGLYVCSNGTKEKILPRIPEIFFYCNVPSSDVTPTPPQVKIVNEAIAADDSKSDKKSAPTLPYIRGTIKTGGNISIANKAGNIVNWGYADTWQSPGASKEIRGVTLKVSDREKAKSCLGGLSSTNINNKIPPPQREGYNFTKVPPFFLVFFSNKIIIVKGNDCLEISPMKMESNLIVFDYTLWPNAVNNALIAQSTPLKQ